MTGFYPDCPSSMNYQVASPILSKVTIKPDPAYYPRKRLIEAKRIAGNNYFIQSMKLNGRKYNKFSINHLDIIKGGWLDSS